MLAHVCGGGLISAMFLLLGQTTVTRSPVVPGPPNGLLIALIRSDLGSVFTSYGFRTSRKVSCECLNFGDAPSLGLGGVR